jgi:hypothetical protein
LQPFSAGAVHFSGGGSDFQARVATQGTKQNADGLFNVGQFDCGIRVVTASRFGDPVVPEFSDKFFHDLQFPTGVFIGV